MTIKISILAFAALSQIACLDLDLKDEVRWLDTDSEQHLDQSDNSSDKEIAADRAASEDTEPNSEMGVVDPPIPDAEDTSPPIVVPSDCGAGAKTENSLCVARGPGNASLRFQTDEAARIEVTIPNPPDGVILSEDWVRHHWVFFTRIQPDLAMEAVLGFEDINGNHGNQNVSISGVSGIPVAITEVLADPLGSEPSQEFVELFNYGNTEVDISGWMVDDNGDENGDYLPDQTILLAKEAAIVVGPTFEILSGPDPGPSPNTKIIVLDGTIGSNGLKNTTFESVELYDVEGQLISACASTGHTPASGVSMERVIAEMPDGDPLAFSPNPHSTSTPGEVPTLEAASSRF